VAGVRVSPVGSLAQPSSVGLASSAYAYGPGYGHLRLSRTLAATRLPITGYGYGSYPRAAT
jgi:hypothetical protein